jgi:hypothetical protein
LITAETQRAQRRKEDFTAETRRRVNQVNKKDTDGHTDRWFIMQVGDEGRVPWYRRPRRNHEEEAVRKAIGNRH